ncbi:MAG: TRAP transporter substrate-binding protein [Deltaproteobacteria bacterium]|nr:TRAP transporter substrate-binding protein [Deltaproteobacteria bacterium]
MRRKFLGLMGLLLAAAVGLMMMPGMASAEPIKLTYSCFFPPTHIQSKLAEAWCKEVEKRSGGKVVVEYYPGQTLTKAAQVYDGVVQGLSDIGFSLFGYTRGRFPVMEVVDLPLGYPNGMAATQVINQVYDKFKPAELNAVQVMYLHAHGPGLLHTRTKPVKTLEDLKGLKIRSHGFSAKTVAALGGTPVAMPMPETYQSLQKGVVDGAMYPMESNKGWKLGEVVKYGTLHYSMAYTSGFFVVMNKDKWNSLPDDVKKVITEINQEWIPKHGQAWVDSDAEGKAFFESKGGQYIALSPAESQKWKEAVQPVLVEYVKDADAKGLPGQAALDFTIETLTKLSAQK